MLYRIGVFSPSTARNFYFAEGTTLGDFATWVAVMNPGDTDTRVTFNYMLGDGTNVKKSVVLAPQKRYTREVAEDVGMNKDVSIWIQSEAPIVAERPMYFGYHGWCSGGHNTLGYGI